MFGISLELVVGVLIGAVLILILRGIYWRSWTSNRQLAAEWARDIKFSDQQLKTMRSLWQGFRREQVPAGDPVADLSPAELDDLLRKVSWENLPQALRTPRARAERSALKQELISKGFGDMAADILSGMKHGRLGPANDL